MRSTENVDISPAQCRAARALLGVTQPELAKAAGFGLSTIVDFEKDRRVVSSTARRQIQKALEDAGIIFIFENGDGVGVRTRSRDA